MGNYILRINGNLINQIIIQVIGTKKYLFLIKKMAPIAERFELVGLDGNHRQVFLRPRIREGEENHEVA